MHQYPFLESFEWLEQIVSFMLFQHKTLIHKCRSRQFLALGWMEEGAGILENEKWSYMWQEQLHICLIKRKIL